MAETDRDDRHADARARTLWDQVIVAIDHTQRHDAGRVARWRERAREYRACADAATAPGSQLAYHVLAGCAESVALRLEDLEARRGAAPGESRSTGIASRGAAGQQ